MGAVDLVIQVESPKSVARGLQRVGRAGHELGAVSRGRIFPKFRADLLESAVVVERMKAGAIEETVIPRNPLDVLAQQIVAICADEEISVDELHELVRGAYNFSDLSRVQLENVLDMLAGRYPSDEFAELRPRIVWDRTGGVDPRARRRAAARGHERGHDSRPRALRRPPRRRRRPGRRARRGDGLRGSGGADVPARRLDLAHRGDHPRPGARLAGAGRAGADPVLEGRGARPPVRARRGDRQGLARARGAARDEGARAADERSLARRAGCAEPAHLPAATSRRRPVPCRRTARSSSSASETRSATGGSASSRRSARACMRRGRSRSERACATRSASRCSRSGRTTGSRIHLPDADATPPIEELVIDPREIEELVMAELGGSALFGSRFRENAAPGAADPAPPSRRADAALAAAAEGAGPAAGRAQVRLVPDHPRDLSRVPPGRLRPAGAEAAAHRAEDAAARPRRRRDGLGLAVLDLAALRLRGELHVRGRHAARGAARPGSVARPRPAEGAARPGGAARPDRRGRARGGRGAAAGRPAQPGRAARRPAAHEATCGSDEYDPELAEPLLDERRAITRPNRRGGAADRGRGRRPVPRRARRDAAGRAARRVPRARRGRTPLELVARFARARGPFTTGQSDRALRDRRDAARKSCGSSSARSKLVRGELRPGGTRARVVRRRTSCGGCVARRWRHCAGRSSPPSRRRSAGSCRAGTASTGARPSARRSSRCRGWRSRSRSGSPRCCRAACPDYRRRQLDQLCATGELVWVGAGLDRVAVFFREDAPALGQPAGAEQPEGETHDRIRDVLARGAEFWFDLLDRDRARGRAGTAGALGSRLGGGGDERRVDAPACGPPLRRPASPSAARAVSRAAALRP